MAFKRPRVRSPLAPPNFFTEGMEPAAHKGGFRGKGECPPEQLLPRSGEEEQRAFERSENASVEEKLPEVSP